MHKKIKNMLLTGLLVFALSADVYVADVYASETVETSETQTASSSESETSAPQSNPTVLERETSAPQSNSTIPESETSAPQSNPAVSESETSAPQSNPSVPESETPAPQSNPSVPESESPQEQNYQNMLQIDDENVYEGMGQAYKNGYEPVVSNGCVSVVLPLYVRDEADIKEVKVTPKLAMDAVSPFVVRNYQKTIKKTNEKINGTQEERQVFLVRFDFELQPDRINGIYPIEFSADYFCNNMALNQVFTAYVHITDGKSAEEETQAPVIEPETVPTSEPKVIILKCEDMPEQIESGDVFSFNVILKNTNKLKYVQNMTVTVTCDNKAFSLEEDSNIFYFDRLGTEAALKLPLTFKCAQKTEPGKYTVTLNLSYDNPEAVSLSSVGQIEIDVTQKMDMDVEVGNVPEEINAGDSMNISIQALNLGRGAVYNVRCKLDVPGLNAEKSLFLGNMDGGSALSGEIKAFAGMVNSKAESEKDRYGQTQGFVELVYEDENGQEYTIQKEIHIKIKPLKISTPKSSDKEEDKSINGQLAAGIVAVVLIIVIGTAVSIVMRKKVKNK